VDEMNDAAFYALSALIKEKPELTPQSLNALIIARNLERVGDHATNIAEDIIFWVRGLDVRHGRGLLAQGLAAGDAASRPEGVTNNSHALHSGVTPDCETERA